MSTPRMELKAAVVFVNVSSILRKEFNYKETKELYHTDSTVVLGYINIEARIRFHTYVRNRVQYIRYRSKPEQWRHVAWKHNPADEASRGLTATELLQNSRWFVGPEFLWQETEQTHPQLRVELVPNDQEVRKEVTTVLTTQQVRRNFPKVLEADRFKHSSSFYRLKRSIVCIQRMIERKRSDKQYNWRIQGGPPTAREFEEAEKLILKSIQYKHFTLKYISVRTFSTRTCFKIDHPPK